MSEQPDPNTTLQSELKCLLEELRVALPGVQILFAFLLMVPFNQRFELVQKPGLVMFVVAIVATCSASILLIAPSMYHRLHWRREIDDQEQMLRVFNRLAIAGGVFLSFGVVASVAFLAEFLFGHVGAIVAAGFSSSLCAALWYVLPLLRRSRAQSSNAARALHLVS